MDRSTPVAPHRFGVNRSASLSRRVMAVLMAPLVALLCGCSIHTPIRVSTPGPHDSPDDRLQVSVTHAVIDPANRAVFDRYVRRIAERLPSQPGLVSHSIRRELFGHQVWTLTVWRSAEDRALFFGSGLHRDALSEASVAIVTVRSVRFDEPRSALPLTWDRALAALGPPPPASPPP